MEGDIPPDNVEVGGLILDDQEWGPMCKRLAVIAGRYLRRMRWRGVVGGHVPQAAEALDFVHDAIQKTLGGSRIWKRDKVALFHHLAAVIKSDINAAVRRAENRRTRTATDDQWDLFSQTISEDPANRQVNMAVRPADALVAEKQFLSFSAGMITQLADGDAELEAYGHLLLDGLEKPQEFSASMKVPVEEIYNIKKRFLRRLETLASASSVVS